MSQAQKIASMASLVGIAGLGLFTLDQCRFTVEPGHSAIMFNRIGGLSNEVYKEGWHFRIPYF